MLWQRFFPASARRLNPVRQVDTRNARANLTIKPTLYEIVDRRQDVAIQLRRFMADKKSSCRVGFR